MVGVSAASWVIDAGKVVFTPNCASWYAAAFFAEPLS